MARPTKYKPEYCQQMINFFSVDPTKTIKDKIIPNDLPTFEKFSADIGVCREVLKEWREKHEAFFNAYKKCKELQKNILVQNGLQGHYQPAFAIFTAKNMTDMRDTVTNLNANIDVNQMSEKEIDSLINNYQKKFKDDVTRKEKAS